MRVFRGRRVRFWLTIRLAGYERNQDPFEKVVTEHLKMNGVYWGLTAMFLLGCEDQMDQAEVLDFVMTCFHECGGARRRRALPLSLTEPSPLCERF